MRLGSLNIVVFLGRLTRDFDVKYVGTNKVPLVRNGIITNRRSYDESGNVQEETTYIEIEAWRGAAENLARHFGKGDPLLIRGRLKLNKWKDRNGNEVQRHVILVEAFENVKGNAESSDDDHDEEGDGPDLHHGQATF